jgi:hypothetical protein
MLNSVNVKDASLIDWAGINNARFIAAHRTVPRYFTSLAHKRAGEQGRISRAEERNKKKKRTKRIVLLLLISEQRCISEICPSSIRSHKLPRVSFKTSHGETPPAASLQWAMWVQDKISSGGLLLRKGHLRLLSMSGSGTPQV